MCWDKCLRLRGDRREHALLVEPNAVTATSILGALETRASDLPIPNIRQYFVDALPYLIALERNFKRQSIQYLQSQ